MPDKLDNEAAPAKTEALITDCTSDTSKASGTGTTATDDRCKVDKEIPPETNDPVRTGKGI